jgi:hypothetical protein
MQVLKRDENLHPTIGFVSTKVRTDKVRFQQLVFVLTAESRS